MTHPFRSSVESRDPTAMVQLLAEDVVLRSSVVFTPYEGRAVVHTVDGRITELAVMVRPLSGMLALAEAMEARLGAAGARP